MSEIIPPSEPGQEPSQPIPTKVYDKNEPPSKKLCTFLGFLLFVVSGGLAYASPLFCFVGFVIAVASLFFAGYRCIFVGYILTLGLILLALIVYCANHPLRID